MGTHIKCRGVRFFISYKNTQTYSQ